jgi:sigma-B regulation protein RsbU (phosphoserine phosphatase)
MFVTLFYAQLDPLSGEVVYVNAGHNPPLLYSAGQDKLVELRRTGMALGVDEATVFEGHTVQLNSGDFLLLYTDGVTEAPDAQGQEFGAGRLRQVIFDHRSAPAAALMEALNQAVGSLAPFDDITVVVARRL